MILTAAVQWSVDSTDQMTVRLPIDYRQIIAMAVVFALIYVVIFLLLVAVKRASLRSMVSLPVLLPIAGCGFMVYLLSTDTATAVLSRSKGTLTITQGNRKSDAYPLQSVQRVQVETSDANSRRMVFLLTSGEEVPFGRWHPREGMYQAAQAINNFLNNVSVSDADPLKDMPPQIRAQHEYARKLAEYRRKKNAGQDPGPEPQPPQP